MKDPITYVIHFKMAMVTVCMPKDKRYAMFYKLLATTFQKMTHQWFIKLPLKSIKNFNKLVNIFITNYACNKLIKKESYYLSSIIQKNDETKKSYMRRFKRENGDILVPKIHCY